MEVDAQVVDRGFLVGDLCRKAGGKGQAGTIVNIKTEIQIMHTLEQEQLPAWYNADSFVGAIAVTRGDHVVHGDWVGIVEETLEIGLVEMSRAGGVPDLRHVCDIGSASKLSVGASSAVSESVSPSRQSCRHISSRACTPAELLPRYSHHLQPLRVDRQAKDHRHKANAVRSQLALHEPKRRRIKL